MANMLKSLIKPKNNLGEINEIQNYFRSGLPTAVFGVSEQQKCAVLGCLEFPLLTIVRDGLTAEKMAKQITEIDGEEAV